MDTWIFLAVLLGAAMHAGWNAIVKTGLDATSSMALVALSMSGFALLTLPWLSWPHWAALPWLCASVVLHLGYKFYLLKAYRWGDLSQVYPIARGTAPLLVAIFMAVVLHEVPSRMASIGMLSLIIGIWLMSIRGGQRSSVHIQSVGFALVTALFIAGYTIVDGLGARANGDPHTYIAWLFVLEAPMIVLALLKTRGRSAFTAMRPYWRSGLCGGLMSLVSYWIAIWAMTVAPIALVAALRETSVLFALLISWLVLREPLTRWRVLAAFCIMIGVLTMRLA